MAQPLAEEPGREVLDVPEEIAPLVNAAVIFADANLAGLGHKLLRQAIEGMAERILRQQIERESRRVARAGLDRVSRRLDQLEKYRHLAPAERKAILDRAETAMTEACRKRIAQHARSQAEDYERVLVQLEGKLDEQSAHLRKIARENAEGYRQVQTAAGRPQDLAAEHAREVATAKRASADVTPAPADSERAGALARKLKLNLDKPDHAADPRTSRHTRGRVHRQIPAGEHQGEISR
jgi:hypothetical protein